MNDAPAVHDEDYASRLLKLHGELMYGSALWRSLGFRTERAFQKAAERNTLPVTVFTLPFRRGRHARTIEVARWLEGLGACPSTGKKATEASKGAMSDPA